VASEILTGHQIGALSGPTFASETALGHLTAATIAFQFSYADRLDTGSSPAARLALSLGRIFSGPIYRMIWLASKSAGRSRT
jgi:glycerol-3-phosphate dehydrogenase (NAD(P)+)